MGDTRGMRALAAMVLLAATGFVTLASAPAAVAATPFPDQCVEQVYGDRLIVPDYSQAFLADLDIGVTNSYNGPDDGPIELVNGDSFGAPGQTWTLRNGYLSSRIRYVIFDNEAPPFIDTGSEPYPEEMRIRPSEWFPYRSPSGDPRWSVQVRSPYAGPGRPIPFTATLTWSDCDADRDYRGDVRDDNCVGLFNPDQRDIDSDRIGDACDPDDDNDGVADTGDNCPGTVNADQTDWDGDRIGNACDSTPGTAPAAPVPTPTTSPTPTTNPVPPTTGCTDSCAYVRTVELRHRAKRHRFQGTVASVADGCRSSVPVTIWRKRSGADRKLVVVTSRDSGAFRTRAPRAAGRYYATVGSAAEPLCGTDRSRVVRVRRR